MSMLRVAVVGLCIGWLVGCGGSADKDSSATGPISGPGKGPGGGVTAVPGAEPCTIHSGYEGDDLCILPPDPSLGFQLHYGPSHYDDPAEVAKYLLMPGEETTDCVFLKTPNDKEVFIDSYHGRLRPGSHHMITFLQDADAPDGGPIECNLGVDARFLVGSQAPKIDIIASDDDPPEDRGLALKIKPKSQAVIQLHYINTTKKPILRESWVNVLYLDPAKVKTLVDPIFWIGGLGMDVAPHSSQVIKGECDLPGLLSGPDELRLVQATGHYHAHTKRFSAYKVPASGERELIYESYNNSDPGLIQFNSAVKNPPPDPRLGKPGGTSGIVTIKKGEKIQWECEVDNTTDRSLQFGNEAYTAEMCAMFGFYAPSTGEPWSCFNY